MDPFLCGTQRNGHGHGHEKATMSASGSNDHGEKKRKREDGSPGPGDEKEKTYSSWEVPIPRILGRDRPFACETKAKREEFLRAFLAEVAEVHVHDRKPLPVLISSKHADWDRLSFRLRIAKEDEDGTHWRLTAASLAARIVDFYARTFPAFKAQVEQVQGPEQVRWCRPLPTDLELYALQQIHKLAALNRALQNEVEDNPLVPHYHEHMSCCEGQLLFIEEQLLEGAKFHSMQTIIDKCCFKKHANLKTEVTREIEEKVDSICSNTRDSFRTLKNRTLCSFKNKNLGRALLRAVHRSLSKGSVYFHLLSSLTFDGEGVLKVGQTSRPPGVRDREYRNFEKILITLCRFSTVAPGVDEDRILHELKKDPREKRYFRCVEHWHNPAEGITKKEYFTVKHSLKTLSLVRIAHDMLDDMGLLKPKHNSDLFLA